MKKKLFECDVHGLTLFRCKRKCWKRGGKKDELYSGEFSEKCFKCISEGAYKKEIKPTQKEKRHLYVKIK